MPKQNRTRFAVLGLLAFGPHSGYSLKRRFEERMSHFWSESLGQIYPTLARLKADGLVEAQPQQDGNRQRIEYSITRQGRRELAEWLVAPSTPQPVRNELLLKLFLATPETLPALCEDVHRHGVQYTAQLGSYAQYTAAIEKVAPSPLQEKLWKLNLRLGELVTEARKTWCAEALQVMNELTETENDR